MSGQPVAGNEFSTEAEGFFHLFRFAIGDVLVTKPFEKLHKAGAGLAEVIGRADDHPVRFPDGFQHGGQVILFHAVPFMRRSLATKAGHATGYVLQPVEVKVLDLRASGGRAFRGFFNNAVRIPVYAGTGINGDDVNGIHLPL